MVGLSWMGDEVKAKYGCECQSKFRYGVTDIFFIYVFTEIVWFNRKYVWFDQICDTDFNYGISFVC